MASEWGVSPLVIDETLTNRQFQMFGERLTERFKRRAGKGGSGMSFGDFVDKARGRG